MRQNLGYSLGSFCSPGVLQCLKYVDNLGHGQPKTVPNLSVTLALLFGLGSNAAPLPVPWHHTLHQVLLKLTLYGVITITRCHQNERLNAQYMDQQDQWPFR